jgi:hypothetical protein
MSDFRNIKLTLPEVVLLQIERIADRRQISLSQLLTQALEDIAAQEESDYAQARARHLAWLKHAANLGTDGQITWTRDALHSAHRDDS